MKFCFFLSSESQR